MPLTEGLRSSNSQNWSTPNDFFDNINRSFGFSFETDLAASAENTKCRNYFTKEDNSLTRRWPTDCWNWLNPPYGRELPFWCEKVQRENEYFLVKTVMLVPARTDTQWFHQHVMNKAEAIYFVEGRIKFIDEFGQVGKQPGFPSIICIYDLMPIPNHGRGTKFGVLNNNGTIKISAL